ncbi:MAG: MarR family winged helix-turn-helix transcriptional regulator [Desulfobacteraceae bacterium]|jgi:DNA-binding MarR family transcriptional regulator
MDKRLFFILNRARHRINKYINIRLIDNFQITSVQAAAILFLERNPHSFLKDLGKGLDMNNSAVTTLVERLEKNDLIIKKKSKTDKRASIIYLTEKGENTAEKIKPFIKEFNKIFENNFSEDEINTVMKFLNFSIDYFEDKKQ